MRSESLLGKISGSMLLAVVLVVGGSFALREIELEILRNDLRNATHQLESARAEGLASEERQAVWRAIHQQLDQCYVIYTQAEEANTRKKTAEDRLVSSIESFTLLIQSTREQLLKRPFTEIRLEDGRVLKGAVITSIHKTGVGFTHAHGITRVESKLLPEDLRLWIALEKDEALDALHPRRPAEVEPAAPVPPPVLAASPRESSQTSSATETEEHKRRDALIQAYESEIVQSQNRLSWIRERAAGLASRPASGRIHSTPAQVSRLEMEAEKVEKRISHLRNLILQARRS